MPHFPRIVAAPIRGAAACLGALVLTLGTAAQVAMAADASATKRPTIVVTARTSRTLGTYLVNANGFTLYTFALDTHGKSACTGACASEWPPVTVPKGGKLSSLVHGVKSSRLGTIKRTNGKLQLTYEGKPLYRFAGDKKPGQAGGQHFDNVWFVALASPAPTTSATVATPTTAVPTPAPAASGTASGGGSNSSRSTDSSPPATSPAPSSPPPTTPPTTQPPPTTTQPLPSGGYGY